MTFMSDLLMNTDFVDISDLDLKDRDISLLHIVEEDDLTNFTFEGLKRRLKIHPEKLSRILSRLLNQEIIKKRNNGYVLTAKAKKILKTKPKKVYVLFNNNHSMLENSRWMFNILTKNNF